MQLSFGAQSNDCRVACKFQLDTNTTTLTMQQIRRCPSIVSCTVPGSGKETPHKYKHIWGVDGRHLFMCFLGSFVMREKNEDTNSPENPGQSRENSVNSGQKKEHKDINFWVRRPPGP